MIESNYTSLVDAIDSETDKIAAVTESVATSSGLTTVMEAESTAYKNFLGSSSLSFSSDNMLKYHYYRKVRLNNETDIEMYMTPQNTLSLVNWCQWLRTQI